jgi:multisubunit Na+/H+ antiporter MnhC subunit
MECLITVFFTTLDAANYLLISIIVIIGIYLLKSIRIRVTIISNNIIRCTWCSIIFTSYYILAYDLDWG